MRSHQGSIDWPALNTVKTLKCSGNTEAGPGYVTCSATDPAVALPNSKKIEVISDRKDFVQI